MSEDNKQNPEEKPSFFEPADEARSWPPADSYEVEDDASGTGALESFVSEDDETSSSAELEAIDFFKEAKPKIEEDDDINLFQESSQDDEPEEQSFIINEELIPEPEDPPQVLNTEPEPEIVREPDALDEILGLEYSDQEPAFSDEKIEEIPESIPEPEPEPEPEIVSEQVQEAEQEESQEEDQESEPLDLSTHEEDASDDEDQEFIEPIVEEFKPEPLIHASDTSAQDEAEDEAESSEFDDSLHDELNDIFAPGTDFKEDEESKSENILDQPISFMDTVSAARFDVSDIIETASPEPEKKLVDDSSFEDELDLVPLEPKMVENAAGFEEPVYDMDDIEPEEQKQDDFIAPVIEEPVKASDPFREDVDELLGTGSTQDSFEENLDTNTNFEEDESSDEDTLPFRTFSAYDYSEETVIDELSEDEEEKTGLAAFLANRNLVILTVVLLLFGGYFTYSTFFVDKRDYVSKRKSRRPKKSKRNIIVAKKETVPVWEVSAQKSKAWGEESRLVSKIYKGAGRKNPFAMPESIIADLRKAAELERLRNQKPNTYRRTAYRATLVGVLTSKDNTIGLINQQSADFDILEGTGKRKILKLATKAMNKAKKNTQEMIVGSYIGPWQIIGISSPQNAFTEAKVTIEYEGLTKVLVMGKAIELGIFTDEGDIDNLEEPQEEISSDY